MRCDYVWLTVLDHCQASCGVLLSLNYHEHASNDFHGHSMIKLLCPLFARPDFGLLIFFTRTTAGWPPPLQVLSLILPWLVWRFWQSYQCLQMFAEAISSAKRAHRTIMQTTKVVSLRNLRHSWLCPSSRCAFTWCRLRPPTPSIVRLRTFNIFHTCDGGLVTTFPGVVSDLAIIGFTVLAKLPMYSNVCWSNNLCQAFSPNYHANNKSIIIPSYSKEVFCWVFHVFKIWVTMNCWMPVGDTGIRG